MTETSDGRQKTWRQWSKSQRKRCIHFFLSFLPQETDGCIKSIGNDFSSWLTADQGMTFFDPNITEHETGCFIDRVDTASYSLFSDTAFFSDWRDGIVCCCRPASLFCLFQRSMIKRLPLNCRSHDSTKQHPKQEKDCRGGGDACSEFPSHGSRNAMSFWECSVDSVRHMTQTNQKE